jgi:hypothetical protein
MSTKSTIGTAPFIFSILSTGEVNIKDTNSVIIWTNGLSSTNNNNGVAPYYLLLANDGSFKQYDSTGKVIFTFT